MMKKKITYVVLVAILVAILAISNVWFFMGTKNLQNQVSTLETDKDNLQNDVTYRETEIVRLNNIIETLKAEISNLAIEKDYLGVQIRELVVERDNLKAFINLISQERDTARTDVEVLQGKLDQSIINIEALTNERNILKEELVEIANEVGDLRWKLGFSIDRIILINNKVTDDGSKLSCTGYMVNAGVTDVSGIVFHIEGWDLLEQKVINMTAGPYGNPDSSWTLNSGKYVQYTCTIDYSPYALSRYNITLKWNATT